MTSSSKNNGDNLTQIVVDASFVFRYLMPTPERAAIQTQLMAWDQAGVMLCAPSLWRYEIVSAITKTHHFAQLDANEAHNAVMDAIGFAVMLFEPSQQLMLGAYAWTLKLRRASAYDSFYLALAKELQCEFWTADKRLFNAVNAPWVHYVGA
jgi:predicted nucleic acid-binding protein